MQALEQDVRARHPIAPQIHPRATVQVRALHEVAERARTWLGVRVQEGRLDDHHDPSV